MREGNVFTLFVSSPRRPCPGPGKGTPYPIPPARTRTGYPLPHPPSQDQDRVSSTPAPSPSQDQDRVPPSCPHPIALARIRRGYLPTPTLTPPSQPGYSPLCPCPVPLASTRAGYSPLVGMPQTGYDAGGTPLAFSRRRIFLFKLVPSFKKLDTASCVYTITDETFKLFIGVAIYFYFKEYVYVTLPNTGRVT